MKTKYYLGLCGLVYRMNFDLQGRVISMEYLSWDKTWTEAGWSSENYDSRNLWYPLLRCTVKFFEANGCNFPPESLETIFPTRQ